MTYIKTIINVYVLSYAVILRDKTMIDILMYNSNDHNQNNPSKDKKIRIWKNASLDSMKESKVYEQTKR